MRKKLLLLFLIFSLMGLWGCRKPGAPSGLVAKAEVTYQRGDETLYRCYTEPRKLSAFLLALRLQDSLGYADEDPEQLPGDRCRIELTRYDGSRVVIRQNCNRYRSRDFGRWEDVDEDQALQLYLFVRYVPGDISETPAWTDTGRRYPAAG